MTRPSSYQRRLIAAVEADPGRDVAHYAAVLGSTVWDVRRSADLLWERGELASEDGLDYLWPAANVEEGKT